MGLLEDKTVLVTGVLTQDSIAFHIARFAMEEGANVILTSYGRKMRLLSTIAKRLPKDAPLVEFDATSQEDIDLLAERLKEHTDHLDGVVHSIGFAPQSIMGGRFLAGTWEDVALAMEVSAFSLKSLAIAALPLMPPGSSIVGLTFDGSRAWPVYDWMGVTKAALEATSRYLARDLGAKGIRSNLVAAGPIRTIAAKAIPGFKIMEDAWSEHAPLAWNADDPTPAARACVALISDWFPATTGEIVHVDGGVHMIGQ